ncbi:hypothetical protein HMPREF1155_0712 [Slackia sp. CM382]|nr:hypothetical protein HMPREF1155_0712 [Slackia sp. CM382]
MVSGAHKPIRRGRRCDAAKNECMIPLAKEARRRARIQAVGTEGRLRLPRSMRSMRIRHTTVVCGRMPKDASQTLPRCQKIDV